MMDETINIFDYLEVLKRKRLILIITFVIVLSTVVIGTYRAHPQYKATATIAIEVEFPSIVPFRSPFPTENFYNFYRFRDYYNTQYQIIKSRDIARRVFERYNLDRDPEFRNSHDPYGLFLSRLKVSPIRESQLVKIEYVHPDRQKAAFYANAVARAYQERTIDDKRTISNEAIEFLSSSLKDIKERITKSEETLTEFLEKENIYSIEESLKNVHNAIAELNQELNKVVRERIRIENNYQRLKKSYRRSFADLLTYEIVKDNEIISHLRQRKLDLEGELARLRSKYGERHPRIVSLEAELKVINSQIDSEVRGIIKSLEKRLEILRGIENTTKKKIKELEKRALALNKEMTHYYTLKRDAETNRKIYDALLTRFKETNVFRQLVHANVKIVEEAQVPLRPFKPNKMMNFLLAVVIGAFLGVGMAFFADYVESAQARIRTEEDVIDKLSLPVLGRIPRTTEEILENYADNQNSNFYESFRFIKTNLKLAEEEKGIRKLLFISSGPQEGKTTVMVNLAKIFGEGGERVLVVDTDLRVPGVHKEFSLPLEGGLTDLIDKGLSLEEVIRETDHRNVEVITAGGTPVNVSEFLEKKELEEMFDLLETRYDRIFFEAPPLTNVSDGLILSRISDGVVLVVMCNKYKLEVISKTKRQLENIQADILGCILNGYEKKFERYGYYEYEVPYYYYYGSQEPAAQRKSDLRLRERISFLIGELKARIRRLWERGFEE
ncbi:MAG: GumC family protein [Candidatus Syntropharchaeia archaeon]